MALTRPSCWNRPFKLTLRSCDRRLGSLDGVVHEEDGEVFGVEVAALKPRRGKSGIEGLARIMMTVDY